MCDSSWRRVSVTCSIGRNWFRSPGYRSLRRILWPRLMLRPGREKVNNRERLSTIIATELTEQIVLVGIEFGKLSHNPSSRSHNRLHQGGHFVQSVEGFLGPGEVCQVRV